jgi:hypothetical protein
MAELGFTTIDRGAAKSLSHLARQSPEILPRTSTISHSREDRIYVENQALGSGDDGGAEAGRMRTRPRKISLSKYPNYVSKATCGAMDVSKARLARLKS